MPKGISIPLYALRQRFITRSAFPVSPDATASMQAGFGRVLPQTCADLYDNASVASNRGGWLYQPPHAIRRSILNIQRGHPHSNPTTHPACRETRQHDGWGHKDRTCGKFSGCSSRLLTRPPFVGRDRILTLPAREYCVWWRYPEKVPRSPAGQLLG